jgi:hypothetical protein
MSIPCRSGSAGTASELLQGLVRRREDPEHAVHGGELEQFLYLRARGDDADVAVGVSGCLEGQDQGTQPRAVHERHVGDVQCKTHVALRDRIRDLLLEGWSGRGIQASLHVTRVAPWSRGSSSICM